jgi:hypothetical protein
LEYLMQRLVPLLILAGFVLPAPAATVPQSDQQLTAGLAGYTARVDGDVGNGQYAFDHDAQQQGLNQQLSFTGRGQMGPFAITLEQYQSHFEASDQRYRQLSWEAALTYGSRGNRWLVEGQAGARYLKLDFRQATESCCEGEWQPLIGLNLAYQPLSELTLSLHSDYAWDADDHSSRQQLAATWDVTAHWQLLLAYQWLLFDRNSQQLPLEGVEQGTLFGIGYRWY